VNPLNRITFGRQVALLILLLPAQNLLQGPASAFRIEIGRNAAKEALPVTSLPCESPGWFPADFGLKDHTVFWYDGSYYIASIYLGSDGYEDRFAYAASPDLCQWQDLGGILQDRPAGGWDGFRIWAPFVHEENGVYYLFYTAVTRSFAQSIMLATSTNPADPDSWTREGVVFQPSHPGSVWAGFDAWSDCRDPTVIAFGAGYMMYYTGLDTAGGIVGLATAPSLTGPWTDWGAVLTEAGSMLESATLATHDDLYYLFYHAVGGANSGEFYRYGPTPGGPWSEAYPFRPGWAHEVWTEHDTSWYTSFLTDYSITIRHLTWDGFYEPPRPFIGEEVYRVFLPEVQ
jgi:hypothetical protein